MFFWDIRLNVVSAFLRFLQISLLWVTNDPMTMEDFSKLWLLAFVQHSLSLMWEPLNLSNKTFIWVSDLDPCFASNAYSCGNHWPYPTNILYGFQVSMHVLLPMLSRDQALMLWQAKHPLFFSLNCKSVTPQYICHS